MGAKKRRKSNGSGVVSEYRADYREHVLSVPETEEETGDSLAFSMDYREEDEKTPMERATPLPEETLEEDSGRKRFLLDQQAEEVVIDEQAYGGPEEPVDPDPDKDLVTGGEILAQEDLPEEEEPILDKEEAEHLGEVVLAAARPLHRRRRYGIPVGIAVLALALVGVVFLAVSIGQAIFRGLNNDSKLREYDNFLTPVVMQDPAPFETIDSADPDMVMTASLWYAILQNGAESYTSYDAEGRSLVPLGDVTAACQELFGPDCVLQPANPKQETFFTFDNTDNQFHVAPYSSQSSYTPYTESERRSGDSVLLRVGYLSPADEYFSDETGNTAPSPAKYMEYELKTNPDTGKQYISAIRSITSTEKE